MWRHFCAMWLHLRQDSIRQLLSILEYPLKFVFFDCLPYSLSHPADLQNPILADFADLFLIKTGLPEGIAVYQLTLQFLLPAETQVQY
jgi:hypothetical protein